MKILAINCGSSSVKAELFEEKSLDERAVQSLWTGHISWSEDPEGRLTVHVPGRRDIMRTLGGIGVETALKLLLNLLWSGSQAVIKNPAEVAMIGHRIVHGGSEFRQSVQITDAVFQRLAALAHLAPLQQPRCLEGISACKTLFADAPQVAVFDTAFHASLPPEAFIYPLPYEWYSEYGIRRYGFHGINHQYVYDRALKLAQGKADWRVITCHLGSGCSLAAISGGRSLRTTMGFTPLEGLMMATRSGSVDPGILTFMADRKHLKPAQLEHVLNNESGLLAVSGISANMREIEDAALNGDQRAQLAVDMFIDRLTASIGSLLPALGGLDLLVFSGGIGENSSTVRVRVCQRLAFLGLQIDADEDMDVTGDHVVSAPDSTAKICVVHAHEELEIARQTRAVTAGTTQRRLT